MINIKVGNKSYKVKEAKTDEEKSKGLQGVKELPKDEGMLFYFDSPQKVGFYMKDTLIPLDIVFINEDQEVIKVEEGVPNDESLIEEDDVSYVLEVNSNSGIKVGDELEIEDSEESPVMKVLAPDGSEQYALWGGERIFRRAFTKQLIRWAKKANNTKSLDEQIKIYKRIGKKMFKEIKAQDERPAEYVQAPI